MSTHKNTFRHIESNLKASIMQNRGGQKVIERIVDAYGFKSRQALCNHLGISQSTMANRYARDTFPSDWILICNLETGVSIEWLAFGDDSKSLTGLKPDVHHNPDDVVKDTSQQKFQIENFTLSTSGGKDAIERLVEAYGFSTRQALADHLNVSKSTLANRYLRDTFPSDWIIKCSIETGVSLAWLTTGEGPKFCNESPNVIAIENRTIINGELSNASHYYLDSSWLPNDLEKPISVTTEDQIFILESSFSDLSDGYWLVKVEGKVSLKHITRVPVGKLKVRDTNSSFECLISDISVLAKCRCIFKKNFKETIL